MELFLLVALSYFFPPTPFTLTVYVILAIIGTIWLIQDDLKRKK